MIWFFSRDDHGVRLETRYDNDVGDYVLVVHWPDGRRQTERFPDAPQFRERLIEFENDLKAGGWVRSGSPEIIADGWRIT